MATISVPTNQACATCSLQQLVPELLERIAELEKAGAAKDRRIAGLEARLARYENPHTPSSLSGKSKTTDRKGWQAQ